MYICSHSLRGSVDWNQQAAERADIQPGHSLRGSVDWNSYQFGVVKNVTGHSLRGSVDWNETVVVDSGDGGKSLPSWECGLKFRLKHMQDLLKCCHSLRGSVDWNTIRQFHPRVVPVTPFVGVWIEIPTEVTLPLNVTGHSLRGSVDWNPSVWWWYGHGWVTPFVGVWIEIVERLFWFGVSASLPSWECGLKSPIPI